MSSPDPFSVRCRNGRGRTCSRPSCPPSVAHLLVWLRGQRATRQQHTHHAPSPSTRPALSLCFYVLRGRTDPVPPQDTETSSPLYPQEAPGVRPPPPFGGPFSSAPLTRGQAAIKTLNHTVLKRDLSVVLLVNFTKALDSLPRKTCHTPNGKCDFSSSVNLHTDPSAGGGGDPGPLPGSSRRRPKGA